jgi:prepilin-type N-terminal cleavage/methylation domain-containing protein
MKKNRRANAFTLIELLTVIAIIGVLIALLFPAIKSALLKAEASKAQTAISGLATAFKAYYTEYGKWPASTTDLSKTICTTNWMVALLRGEDKTGSDPLLGSPNVTYNGNPRKIHFLDMKTQDLIIDPVNNVTNFVDPWKNQYEVSFDDTYSDTNRNPFIPAPEAIIHEGFLVWSRGPDGQEGSYFIGGPLGDGVGVNKDNIKSW